ncbi:PH domain-containing protein [Methylomonas sp. AM2-LC]|uniref:PH domain-containing protein n=1 Tax=Methylomonas sp. AM2-LC TaxID=3153301 RepID=UPI003265ADD3
MSPKAYSIIDNSFSSYDDATEFAVVLSRETKNIYQVMPDGMFGFTASKTITNTGNKITHANERHDELLISGEYKQSFLGFIENYLEIMVGVFMILKPVSTIYLAFRLVAIQDFPEWINRAGLIGFTKALGVFWFAYGLRFIYSYFSNRIYFEDDGVILRKGLIALSQVQIRYLDIKTVQVSQSITERMLGIGTLRMDSAGRNGMDDIKFKNIRNPIYIRRLIQKKIDSVNKNNFRDSIRDHI